MKYIVYVKRNEKWIVLGEYPTQEKADGIARILRLAQPEPNSVKVEQEG